MKGERNIFIAFILNLSFSIFEFWGGIFTGSVAITSDAVHDLGDAASIGLSYFFEKKSRKQPDQRYSYGYTRYSVMGGFLTTIILLMGSSLMIYNAIMRIANPGVIHYNGMILFAIVGVCVNFCAALITHKGVSLNQKAVNLHMLEDVLGWLVVLVGSVIMRFTDFALIDPIMSIGVSLFILFNAGRNLKEIIDLFLEKVPNGICTEEIIQAIRETEGVIDVHHLHIWGMDESNILATMHIVSDRESEFVKSTIRNLLRNYGITHITIEHESSSEHCNTTSCDMGATLQTTRCHHHHTHLT